MPIKSNLFFIIALFFILLNCQGRRVDDTTAENNAEIKTEMLAKYYEFKEKDFPNIKDISVEDYLLMSDTLDSIVLVDTREKKEYDVSIIPGAITKDEFEVNKQTYTGYTVISYCTIGARSGDYTELLESESFNAINLIGGVLSWAHAGKLFIQNGAETNRVHVYAKEWNYLPSGYIAVY